MKIFIQFLHEIFKTYSHPVSAIEEPILNPSEQPLTCRVIKRVSFLWHGPCPPILIHTFNPAGQPVAAPSVRVYHRFCLCPKFLCQMIQHRIYQVRIRMKSNRPGRKVSVKAVDDRWHRNFSRRQGKLCDIGFFWGAMVADHPSSWHRSSLPYPRFSGLPNRFRGLF